MKRIFLSILVGATVWGCNPKTSENKGTTDSTATSESASENVKVDGSSTVYPITEAVAEDFNAANPKIKVTIGIAGTGGGFKKFLRKEIDIADASRIIKTTEDSAAKADSIEYIELPIAFDGICVVVSTQNTWVDYLTVEELKKMWEPEAENKIKTWNQIRPTWPKEEIHLFGAGTQSGTFEYFTEAIVGKAKSSRSDFTGSEDDNVLVTGVSTDKLALGFFGLDYYETNKDKLKIVPIDDKKDDNGKGAITPSAETVKNTTYQPLSRPLFIYVSKASAQRPEVDSFVNFYLNNAEKLVAESGYVPLTPEIYTLVKSRYASKTTGSIFREKDFKVGMKIEDILK